MLDLIKRAETLAPHEVYWRDKQSLLASHGYTLRPRFRKGWRPSWLRKPTADPYKCEDFVMLHDQQSPRIDARRAVDGRLVHIRAIPTDSSRMELMMDLSSGPLVNDSRNHCLPILDSFQDDQERNITYIVTPHTRRVDDPRFELVHDVLDFAEQVLDGLTFLHERGVLMGYSFQGVGMDAHSLYSRGYQPVDNASLPFSLWQHPRYSRTSAPQPVRYYFTDVVRAEDLMPNKPEAIQTHDSLSAELHDLFSLNVDTIGWILKKLSGSTTASSSSSR